MRARRPGQHPGDFCEIALNRKAWDEAERFGSRGIELATTTGQRLHGGWLQAHRASLAIGRNDLAAARAALLVAAEVGLALNVPAIKASTELVFARLLLAQGQAVAASQVLAVALGEASLGGGEHERMRRLRMAWVPEGAPAATPSITLDTLLHRVAAEAGQDHAALTALLAA